MTRPATSSSLLQGWFTGEAGSGGLLIVAAVAALLLVNVVPGGADIYHHLLHAPAGPVLAPKLGSMTAHLWINDGLMAIFFFVVGLEIKREWTGGALSDWQARRLPFLAAGAGMLLPAIVYLATVRNVSGLAAGWAIPAATDIAFAMGVLALLGRRVPASLKLLLTTIAIVDDMGAVAIIALAYTTGLDLPALAAAGLVLGAMLLLGRMGVRGMLPYLLGFALLWYCTLLSGVHATVAGVLAALAVPQDMLARLEHALHPWSAWAIVPIFGFANAGVAFPADMGSALLDPVPLGIALGLFLGKQVGIFGAIRLAVATGLAVRPQGAGWAQLYGMALLCGIGFTMSLFIGALAFAGQPALVEEAKIGVLAGSLLSALFGLAVLRLAPVPAEAETP